jgi:hypothetical protein
MSLEVQSERVAVVAAVGTINIVHCLKILGDLAEVHATPADSGECLSENWVLPW